MVGALAGNEEQIVGVAHFATQAECVTFVQQVAALQIAGVVTAYNNLGNGFTWQVVRTVAGAPTFKKVLNDSEGKNWRVEIPMIVRCIAPL